MATVWIYRFANEPPLHNPLYTVMIGTNDANTRCTDPLYSQVYEKSLAASIDWLTTPRTSRIYGQDPGVHRTGIWAPDNSLSRGLALSSSTKDSRLSTVVFTAGESIDIAYRAVDGNLGQAKVTIDDQDRGTLNAYGPTTIATRNKTVDTVFLDRYPVQSGRHVVNITIVSPTTATSLFSLAWIGTTPPPNAVGLPRTLVGGVLRQENDVNAACTASYDRSAQTVVTQLKQDGLAVTFIPVRDYVNATSDMFNRLHPNMLGHQRLRDAFEAEIRRSHDAPIH